MSFAAPLWLAAAALVGVGVVVAHLISTSVPQREVLPTVRFVPEGAPLTALRTRRLTDLVLLLLRLVAIALTGLALSGARIARDGPPLVVLADGSRAVASVAEVRDSVASFAEAGATIVAFDSAARRVPFDSLPAAGGSGGAARGSLSAALVSLYRTLSDGGRILSDITESRLKDTPLVIVSPLVREELDSATTRLLAMWNGPVRLVRVAVASLPAAPTLALRAAGDDPVAAALTTPEVASAPDDASASVRLVRTTPTARDSAWAREGGALVLWPATMEGSILKRRDAPDTQQGVAAGSHVVIGNFARTNDPRPGRALALWLDGAPAATEAAFGRGCIREVAIPVDRVGDVALRDNFRRLARTLAEPCGGIRDFTSVALGELGVAGERQAPDSSLRTRDATSPAGRVPTRDGAWLAVMALAVLIAEQVLRHRGRTA